MLRTISFNLLVVAGAVIGAGCDSAPLIVVKGRITQNGRPVRRGLFEKVHVSFIPVRSGQSPPDTLYNAVAGPDGKFELRGAVGKGIPQGRYRVSVQLLNPDDIDRFQGRFGPVHSPLVREVSSLEETQEIDIDLG